MDKKISQLTALTTADLADVYAIVDDSANETKKISQQDLEVTIANSSNFTDELVANTNFTTDLANDTNFTDTLANNNTFVNELTSNTTFQSAVNNFVTNVTNIGSGGGGKPITFLLTESATASASAISGYQDSEAVVYVDGANLYLQDTIGYTQSRDLTTDWASATAILSYVLLGAYAYVLLSSGVALRVYRYNRNDLSAGGTLMTISGATLTYGANVVMTSNGTNFYFNYDAGQSGNSYSIAKFTLSGTTLTYVSATSAGSTANQFDGGFAVDASGKYYGTNAGIVYQYNTSGTLTNTSGSTLSTITDIVNWADTFYGCDSSSQVFSKLYIEDTDVAGAGASTMISADPSTVTVAGTTTTEQTLFSASIPGGTLSTDRVLKAKVSISNLSHESVDLTFKLKYGSTTLATLSITPGGGINMASGKGYIEAYLVGNAGTNAQKGALTLNVTNTGIDEIGAGGYIGKELGTETGTATEDSTITKTFSITSQWASSNINNTITKFFGFIELA